MSEITSKPSNHNSNQKNFYVPGLISNQEEVFSDQGRDRLEKIMTLRNFCIPYDS